KRRFGAPSRKDRREAWRPSMAARLALPRKGSAAAPLRGRHPRPGRAQLAPRPPTRARSARRLVADRLDLERHPDLVAEEESALRRCLSRSGASVSTLSARMRNSTLDDSGIAGSSRMVPAKSLNRPGVLLSRWRTLKPASEWFLSTTKVWVVADAADAVRVK